MFSDKLNKSTIMVFTVLKQETLNINHVYQLDFSLVWSSTMGVLLQHS